MKTCTGWLAIFILAGSAFSQSPLDRLIETEKQFDKALAEQGMKGAFLQYLADDAVVFRPHVVNGKEFWRSQDDSSPALLIRHPAVADIASNGIIGYTTGRWELYPKGNIDPAPRFGQYVTVWERRQGGSFKVVIDIGTSHDKPETQSAARSVKFERGSDRNNRGRSAADASMNFMRTSMSRQALSGAYEAAAAENVRVLLDREPPIVGKKNVVAATRNYRAIDFPTKVALFESADMAYAWNPCEYDNTNEGMRKGNCLHIWKLRDKKWWIVLGVFAAIPQEARPEIKVRQKRKGSE